jgi:hypothetical protein
VFTELVDPPPSFLERASLSYQSHNLSELER